MSSQSTLLVSRFTEDARFALISSRRIASQRRVRAIGTGHLFAVISGAKLRPRMPWWIPLLPSPRLTALASALASIGVKPIELQEALRRMPDEGLTSSKGNLSVVLTTVLSDLELSDGPIDSTDLARAVLAAPSPQVAFILRRLGISPEDALAAVESVAG